LWSDTRNPDTLQLDTALQSCEISAGSITYVFLVEVNDPKQRTSDVIVAVEYDDVRYLQPLSRALRMEEGKFSGTFRLPLPIRPSDGARISMAYFLANSCIFDATGVSEAGGTFNKRLSDVLVECSDSFLDIKTVVNNVPTCSGG